MDTSVEYVKMCEKATEIQKNYNIKRRIGDYFFDKSGGGVLVWVSPDDGSFYLDTIYIPRQDQLQEILYKDDQNPCGHDSLALRIGNHFSQFMYKGMPNEWNRKYGKCIGSMEQLWLAYVMYEKYSKVWAGTDWEPAP